MTPGQNGFSSMPSQSAAGSSGRAGAPCGLHGKLWPRATFSWGIQTRSPFVSRGPEQGPRAELCCLVGKDNPKVLSACNPSAGVTLLVCSHWLVQHLLSALRKLLLLGQAFGIWVPKHLYHHHIFPGYDVKSPTVTQGRLSGFSVINLSLTQLLAVSLCSFYPLLSAIRRNVACPRCRSGSRRWICGGVGFPQPSHRLPRTGALIGHCTTNKQNNGGRQSPEDKEGRDGRRLCWESMDFCLTSPKDLC